MSRVFCLNIASFIRVHKIDYSINPLNTMRRLSSEMSQSSRCLDWAAARVSADRAADFEADCFVFKVSRAGDGRETPVDGHTRFGHDPDLGSARHLGRCRDVPDFRDIMPWKKSRNLALGQECAEALYSRHFTALGVGATNLVAGHNTQRKDKKHHAHGNSQAVVVPEYPMCYCVKSQ